MLSQPKSAVRQQAAMLFQQNWRHLKGKYAFNSAFEKADRLLEKKRTDSQFHSIAPITLKANLCWHLPKEIFQFNNKLEEPPKNYKTTRDAWDRICFGNWDPDPRVSKNDQEIKKKVKKCAVLKCWLFFVKRQRHPVAWMSFLRPVGAFDLKNETF
jgi:hypothetical protein